MQVAPRILLLDDSPEFLLATAIELVRQGYRVTAVLNGKSESLSPVVDAYLSDRERMPILGKLITGRQLIWDKVARNSGLIFTDRSEIFLTGILEMELESGSEDLVILTDQGVSTLVMDKFQGTELAAIARQKGFAGPILVHSQQGVPPGEYDHAFKKIDVRSGENGARLKAEIETGIAAAVARLSGASAAAAGTAPLSPAAGGSWAGIAKRGDIKKG